MILSENGQRVTYINKKRSLVTRPTQEALDLPGVVGREITDRVKYAKEVLSQMIIRSNAVKKKQSETASPQSRLKDQVRHK